MVTKNQRGITGLETAIILIAFVMVASVFAYVVMSAGLFSSQKAKEAVHQGLEESSGSMELRGHVLAEMVGGYAKYIYMTVSSVSGGEPIDFTGTDNGTNKIIISYSDAYNQYPTVNWTINKLVAINQDNLLDENELFQIIVDLSVVTDNASSEAEKLGAYKRFLLEVKPSKGAVLAIERTLPGRVTELVNLY